MIYVSDSHMSTCCSCVLRSWCHASFPLVTRVVRVSSHVICMCHQRRFHVSFACIARCPRTILNCLFIITCVSQLVMCLIAHC
jgi:hypothetical protein